MPRRHADRFLVWTLRAGGAISGLLVTLVAAFVVLESWPALREIGIARFLTDPSWHPTENRFNLTAMLVGTLVVTTASRYILDPNYRIAAAQSTLCEPSLNNGSGIKCCV